VCSGKGPKTLKKLGIIGGSSWASTALYYEHLNRGIGQRLGGLHSAVLSIESLDLAPFAAMQQSGDWDGVASIAVEAETGLPVLHIADAAADRLLADGRSRVALLGTRFTMTEPYVRERIESRGIALAPVDAGWTREVDRIVYEELAAGRVIRDSQRKLKSLITELAKQKVQAIVLGCTELGLAVDTRANVLPVYDTTAIHARYAVDWMLEEEEQARAAA
jgi:aspartate racemase